MLKIKEDPKNRAIFVRIKQTNRKVATGIRKAFFQIGKTAKAYANKKMQEPKSGKTYAIKRLNAKGTARKITYVASAPGEFPLSQAPKTTAATRKSLNFLVKGS